MGKKILKLIVIASGTCAALFLVELLLGFFFRWLYQTTHFSQTALQAIYSALSYALTIVILIFIAKKLKKPATRSSLGLTGLPTWMDLGLAPIAFIAYTILAAIIVSLFNLFPWFDPSQTQNTGFSPFLLGIDRFIVFFALVVIAPIAEEIIFRGFLYSKLKSVLYSPQTKTTSRAVNTKKSRFSFIKKNRELPAIIVATLITSLVFALMHGQWNVSINVFALSLVLCILREITGTIYSGILVHIIKNAVAFVLLYVISYGI